MNQLLQLFKEIYGEPVSIATIKKDDVEFAVAIADTSDEEDSVKYIVLSIGLSKFPPFKKYDMELRIDVRADLPEDAPEQFGELFYTIFKRLEAKDEHDWSFIYRDLTIPFFPRMKAVLVEDGDEWFDEMSEPPKGLMVQVIPLLEEDADELEKLEQGSRRIFYERSFRIYENPDRKQTIVEASTYNLWNMIAEWYEENGMEIASDLKKALSKAPDPKAGKALEKKLGFALPDDFNYSFNLVNHRISNFDAGRMYLYTEEQILNTVKFMNEYQRNGTFKDAEENKLSHNDNRQHVWWHERWIPVAADSNGNFLALDMAPGPIGFVGQVIVHGNDVGPMIQEETSYFLWLDNFLGDLRSGRYRVEDGCLVE